MGRDRRVEKSHGFRHWDLVLARHRRLGKVVGVVQSLKTRSLVLRTGFDDAFPVAYSKSRVLCASGGVAYVKVGDYA